MKLYRDCGLFSIENKWSLILVWLGFICMSLDFNNAFGMGGDKERSEKVAGIKKRNDFYRLEKKELKDFEFKSSGSKLRVPDVNNQRGITAFWKYCEECKHTTDVKTLVAGFSQEYVEEYDAISYFYKRMGNKELCCNLMFLDMDIMIENIALAFRKKRGVDFSLHEFKKYFICKADDEKKVAKKSGVNLFSNEIIEYIESHGGRGFDIRAILTDNRPCQLPELYWQLVTRIGVPIGNNKRKIQSMPKSPFALLSDQNSNGDDPALSAIIYLLSKVISNNGVECVCVFNMYVRAMFKSVNIEYHDLLTDGYGFMEDLMFGNLNGESYFEPKLNCGSLSEIKREAKIMKPKLVYSQKRPRDFPLSLWLVVMEVFSKIERYPDISTAGSLKEILDYDESHITHFLMSFLKVIFYCPKLSISHIQTDFDNVEEPSHSSYGKKREKKANVSGLEVLWRRNIEYWIQRMLFEKGGRHIKWREEIRQMAMPI